MRLKKFAGIMLALMLIVNSMTIQALAEPKQSILPQIETISSFENTSTIASTNSQSADITQKTTLEPLISHNQTQWDSKSNVPMTHPEYITIPDKNGGYTVRYYDGTEEFFKLWKQYENYRFKPTEIVPTKVSQPLNLNLNEPIGNYESSSATTKSSDPDLLNATPLINSEKTIKYGSTFNKITSPNITKTPPKLLSEPTLTATEGSNTISGSIKLPDGMLAPVGGVGIEVMLYSESGYYVTGTSLTIPENTNSITYSLSAPTSTNNYAVRCNIYNTNSPDLWYNCYYNSIATVSDFERATLVNTTNGNLEKIDITLIKTKKISGTVSLPNQITVPPDSSISIEIELSSYYNGNWYYYDESGYAFIEAGKNSDTYKLILPADYENTRCMLEYNISNDSGLDLLSYAYFGPNGVKAFEENAEEISLSGQNDLNIDFEIPQLSTITGTISLPMNMAAPDSDLAISVHAELVGTDATYYNVDYIQGTIPAGQASIDYSLKVPASQDLQGFNGYRIYYYVQNSYGTNLVESGYYNASGVVSNKLNATLVNVPNNSTVDVDFTLLEKQTISGVINLPDNLVAPVGGLTVSVHGEFYNTFFEYWDSFGTTISIPEGSNSVSYSLIVPQEYELTSCYLYYSLSSSSLSVASRGYYSSTGTVSSRNTASAIDLSQGSANNVNFEMLKAEIISGIISLPGTLKAPTGGLQIEVSARKPNGYSWTEVAYTVVKIDENQSSAAYSLSIAPDSQSTGYWVNYYVYDNKNLNIIGRGYYSSTGIVNRYRDAELVNLGTTNLSITIPDAMVISGTITLPGTLTAPVGGLDIYLYADLMQETYIKESEVAYTYITMNENTSSVDYTLMVPKNKVGEGYSINYEINDTMGLEILDRGYYSSSGTAVSERDNTVIDVSSVNAESINFYLPAARTISGVISLPANITIPAEGIEVTISAESQIDEYSWTSIAFDHVIITPQSSIADYKLLVPQNHPGKGYIVSYDIYDTIGLNIVSSGFATESGTTSDRAIARIIDVSQSSVSGFNLNIPSGNLISGVVSLPEGILAPQNGLDVSLEIQEFQGPYEWNRIAYKDIFIPSGSNSVNYSIAIAPGSAATRVEYNIWNNEGLPIVKSGYYGAEETTVIEDDALPIDAGFSDRNGIDIKLIKGKVISGSITIPSSTSIQVSNISGNICVDARTREGYFSRILGNYINFGNSNNNVLEYSILVPEYVDEAIVYTDLWSTAGTNILRYAYYNTTGSVAYPEDAEIITLGTSDKGNININLLTGNTISGTVYLPSNLNISEPLYVSLSVESLNQLKRYYSYGGVNIEPGLTSADYSIAVPQNLQFRLSYNIWEKAGQNIISRGYYTSAGTTPYRNSAEAMTAPSNITGANLNVLQGNMISGKISLPNNELAPAGGLEINASAYNSEANGSASVIIPAGANSADYTLYMPANEPSDPYNVQYYFYGTQANDSYVVSGVYSTQGTTFDYNMAAPVDISAQNAVGIDLTLLKPVPAADDVSNTPSEAFQLQLGAEKAAKLEYVGDVDYFTFTTTSEGAYVITSNSAMDMYGYLNESTSNYRLVENDDYNTGDFRIIGNLRANTKYYIKARHYSDGTGDYIIMVNKVSSHLEGDVNKDYKVDIDDLVALALAYGSTEGEANYNINADFNMDKVIDIKDLSTLAVNYGRMN